jgi:ATP-dependent Lon protease
MSVRGHDLIPLLPLRGGVLLPHVGTPLVVGRRVSVVAIERANESVGHRVAVFGQRDPEGTPRGLDDFFRVGATAEVRSAQRVDNALTVVLQGLERASLEDVVVDGELLLARVNDAPVEVGDKTRTRATCQEISELLRRLVKLHDGEPDVVAHLVDPDDPVRLAYSSAALVGLDVEAAQRLLEMDRLDDALQWLVDHLSREVHSTEVRRDIAQKVAGRLGAQQRELVLREQLQHIREELGEGETAEAEIDGLRRAFEKADLPEPVRKEADRELKRLRQLPALAPEYHVVRSYLELLVELPWNRRTDAKADISAARKILDADHHALDDVKERILEHLAVLQLNPAAKAPILCFLGPPGVGKTSLGHSIARSLGRRFERMSLGGVHDESELRGHRRTYIGSMPGRIIQAIRRADVADPLIMLDEIDKIGRDFRGDPTSALLEILDPEQNNAFRDNYLDLPFDLSKVLFITTCNTLDTVPRPLLDRMEVVRLPGYGEEEKEQIAERFLLPRQLANAGLDEATFAISDDLLPFLIRRYTREAGVRQLERCIARLIRKVALDVAEHGGKRVVVTPAEASAMLGPPPHVGDLLRDELPVGVAAGLAWTEAGGEVLYVEAAKRPGTSDLTLTGHLGDVMQESAKAAVTCVWSRIDALSLARDALQKVGLHVHVPSGAVPKDGPSAGVAIVTALASLMTGHPARPDTAMTGEITITGLVLPVGAIKEKLLAARRAGLHRVILPKENESDLADVDEHVLHDLTIVFAERIEHVWAEAIPGLGRLTRAAA